MAMRPDRVFVYILELDDGFMYIGYTPDLRKGLAEHREQKVVSTAGRHPRLRFAQIMAPKAVAERRVAELKRMVEDNPEQIQTMIDDFSAHMREMGYEDY